MGSTVTLLSLNSDVISEILCHLDVEDIVNARRVCRALMVAAYEHNVWYSVYKRSKLLLPVGPTSHQQARDLERLLIRSTHLYRTWGPNASGEERISKRYTFPRSLPAYSFDAQVISGRYLQLAEQDAISWYDLDGDCDTPLLTFKCQYIATITGYLSHQTNAQGEGENSIWVTFICSYPMTIKVIKLFLGPESAATVEATLSAESVVEVKLGCDYILPVREFVSRDDTLELFHIPTKTTFHIPRHAKVQRLNDLNHATYLFSSNHLLVFFPLKSETHVEVYPLPHTNGATPNLLLECSHQGIYPHMISRSNLFDRSSSHPLSRNSPSAEVFSPGSDIITLLSVVYMRQTQGVWTSKVKLHLLDAELTSLGGINFTTRCSQTLQVGIAATTLSSTSRNGTGYAITHSSPGPTIRVYHIQRQDHEEPTMTAKSLQMPPGLQSREMLAFDGYRGRLCLVHGWTRIEIIDYA